VQSLTEEKNALLDYIDENMDKNQSLSAKKPDHVSHLQSQIENLTFQVAELKT
jgi:hypothetical protein